MHVRGWGRQCVELVVAVVLLPAGRPVAWAADSVTVDVGSVINEPAGRPVGMNSNYLMDSERARRSVPPRGTEAGLAELAPGFVRYPGGEKSDAYLWSVAPWTSSVPTLARTGPDEWPAMSRQFTQSDNATWIAGKEPLSFDEFVAICLNIGAEPTICVAYDSAYKPATPPNTSPSLSELLTNAVEWVRYANVTRGYNVTYWELGNETDYGPSYAGADPGAAQYAADLIAFSAAMKAVDPTIKIGANGQSAARFQAILTNAAAAAAVDFLAVHDYPAYNWTAGYEQFRTSSPSFTNRVRTALAALDAYAPPADKARIKVALTEINAVDWADGGWENVNDLGHALVLFDMLGQHLMIPELLFTQVWNTRWVENDATALPAGTSNLLGTALNPGFEDGTNGWAVWAGTAEITSATNDVYEGTNALRCSGTGEIYAERQVPADTLSPDTVYTFHVRGKVSGTTQWSGAGLDFKKQGSKVDGYGPTIDSASYAEYATPFVAPSDFDELVLWVYRVDSTDVLYVDDFRITAGAKPSVYDALSPQNELQAVGRVAAIWGQFLGARLVEAAGTSLVRAYATHSPTNGVLSVFLLNKDTSSRAATVTLSNYAAPATAARRIFTGAGPTDMAPTWTQAADVPVTSNQVALTLDAVSVTVLTMTPPDEPPACPAALKVQPEP
ncbi:MAG: carbohydrate binding domain-containing protein [Kiritimatiellae bacterium]|nr:carbohydrate binding domain-containing protein [Kiritimatiellia bacterium]